ncbi:MAG: hypothetical protein BIFFINMI_02921 [Phycisphaerae bacterium]|nr:hypothetical protein [Phycisphaerae bacterium]
MTFSDDRDLLIFEPRLFAELAWPAQTLAAGDDGELDGAAFIALSADFLAAGVDAGMVLHVESSAGPAALEITSVDSATQLAVSALRSTVDGAPIVPTVAGSGLTWRITSFAAQTSAVAMEMLTAIGVAPGDPGSRWSADDIADPDALRTVSAHGVLAALLAGAAAGASSADGYWTKASHYRRLFERGLARVRVGLDADGDGEADVVRDPGAPRLRRD